MVVGRTSNFVEGFKSFTVDDELMLANLKQALNYSAENLSIPDAKLNLPSTTKQSSNNKNNNNTIRPRRTSPQEPTTTMPVSMDSPMPTGMGSSMGSTMPTGMGSGMGSTMPTGMGSGMNSSMGSGRNVNGESFKDIKKVSSGSQNSTRVYDEDESDDEEDAVLEEEEYPNRFEEEAEEKEEREHSTTRRQHQAKGQIEGFQGSVEIEGRNLKNVLLALLLSFIGYVIVYASMNNYIPIGDISPQLKKFKNLVYGGIFFIIAYICLEVF